MPRLAALGEEEIGLGAGDAGSTARWLEAVRAAVAGSSLEGGLLPLGQDACFAKPLAARFNTVSGIIAALRGQISDASRALAANGNPLREGNALAVAHRTRYPITQGPMTRVSDRAEFAAAVAEAGALPFLALALMRAPEVDTLLEQTRRLAGDRSWGVGVLGFVPAELRQEQLAVVKAHRPPFALIAGGRPDQAADLEAEGISTYLHVPSPGLLRLYLAEGARKFIFEGRECGGHVGPRSSFVLWESVLQILADELPKGVDPSEIQILFAGGIHDARSASMVAAAAALAAERGIAVGVLAGTVVPVHARGGRARRDQRHLPAGCRAGVGYGARRVRPRPRDPLPRFAVRGLLRSREAPPARRGDHRRAAAPGARGAEHRPPADRVQGRRPQPRARRGPRAAADARARLDRAVGPGDVHDRSGRLDAPPRWSRWPSCTPTSPRGSGELLAGLPAPGEAEPGTPAVPPQADIAIIGMSCILPGAPDLETLWANILGKVDAVSEVPIERWNPDLMYDADPSTPDRVYSRWGGFIAPVAFNPMALGIPPKALGSIEPFQLLALLTAQNALADAGYANRPFGRERTSVILGAGGGGGDRAVGYTVRSMLPSLLGRNHPELERELSERLPEWTEDSFAGILMNVAAGRIANRLDLGGTNYTVDAACASSLAAISLAVKELQAGTSDMVLAGGVDALQNPFSYLCFAKTRALSARGRCRPLDASADGIAISEGFATIVLKRREDAERDGDRIYAIIRGVGASLRRARQEPDGAAARGPDARAPAGLRPGTLLARRPSA